MDLSFDALAAHEGSALAFETSSGTVELTLVGVTPREGGGSLLFHGPLDAPLAQGTYPVRADDLEGVLFVVPVGREEGLVYEAVFG